MLPSTFSRVTALLSIGLLLAIIGCREKNSSEKKTGIEDTPKTTIAKEQTPKENLQLTKGKNVIKIRYFFSESYRCMSCQKIETYTKKAVNEAFATELESGQLEFSMVDIDKDDNKPEVEKYKLISKSVIISEFSGGQEVKWQNLDKVWMLLNDEDSFKKYIIKEVKSYL